MRVSLFLLLIANLSLSCTTKLSLSSNKYQDRLISSELGNDLDSKLFFLNETTYMELSNGKIFVRDSNKIELEKLKNAVETLFSSKCPQVIAKSTNQFLLELASCIPSRLSSLIGSRTRAVPGPNCYSYSLYPLGIVDPIRRVKEDERELFFNNQSSFCKSISAEHRRPGDIAYLGSHSFMYLTEKFALSSAGAGRVYEFTTNQENLGLGPSDLKLNDLAFFRCSMPKVATPKNIQNVMNIIIRFEEYLQKYFFIDGLSQENLEIITKKINELEKDFTMARAKLLLDNTDNPIVLLKLYSLVGIYYTISKIHHRLGTAGEAGGTSDKTKADFFRPAHISYLKVLDRIVDPKQSKIFDSYTLSVISDFCANEKKEIPNLCTFYESYTKGELNL